MLALFRRQPVAGGFIVDFTRQISRVTGSAFVFKCHHERHELAAHVRGKCADFRLQQFNAHKWKLRPFGIAGKLEYARQTNAITTTGKSRRRVWAMGFILCGAGWLLGNECLRTNMLPHADVKKHHLLNVNAAHQFWVRCKTVTLARLRNNATLMKLRNLK